MLKTCVQCHIRISVKDGSTELPQEAKVDISQLLA